MYCPTFLNVNFKNVQLAGWWKNHFCYSRKHAGVYLPAQARCMQIPGMHVCTPCLHFSSCKGNVKLFANN